MLGKSSSVSFFLSNDDLSTAKTPKKKYTHKMPFVRAIYFFSSSSCTSTFAHTIHNFLCLFVYFRWEKWVQKIPCIDIFNNSFYCASTIRATACRTSSNCSPENLVVLCQKRNIYIYVIVSALAFCRFSLPFFPSILSIQSLILCERIFLYLTLPMFCMYTSIQGLKRSVTTLRGGSLGYAEIVAVKV